MSRLRVILWIGASLASGCGAQPDDGEGAGSMTMTTGGAPTEPTSAPTTSADGTTSAIVDTCPGRPGGDWNACFVDGHIDNKLCNYTMGANPGAALCLSPTSGTYNVCGVRDCIDDCDCFAPPATGTAIPICDDVFTNGGRGCVLYCANGQLCPDGMECVSGTCYWPN